MPSGRHKSRTLGRVFKRTPASRVVVRYKKRKPSVSKCSECGANLQGTLRERPYKMSNLPKTKKRPERPYGGTLCSKCMRRKIISQNR